jgi:hypothetical protein
VTGDCILTDGKYAGCRLSDVPRAELGHVAFGRGTIAPDRWAAQAYWYARRERIPAARRPAMATARGKAA